MKKNIFLNNQASISKTNLQVRSVHSFHSLFSILWIFSIMNWNSWNCTNSSCHSGPLSLLRGGWDKSLKVLSNPIRILIIYEHELIVHPRLVPVIFVFEDDVKPLGSCVPIVAFEEFLYLFLSKEIFRGTIWLCKVNSSFPWNLLRWEGNSKWVPKMINFQSKI